MHRRTPLRMGPLRFRDPVLLCGVLYGLLLCSGNDAAAALADHCGGTASFVRRMNGLARELGLASLQEEGQLFSSLNAVSLLVQLTVLFARQALSADRPADAQGPDHRELLRYMYLHCGQKLTLQQLADVFLSLIHI